MREHLGHARGTRFDEGWARRIRTTYDSHPLGAGAIAARALDANGAGRIVERDLARSDRGGLTDQNHVGGAGAVIELAEAAGVHEASRVLDVGSGLGGPARLLATRFGAPVVGVDLSPERHAGARLLTRLVGLDERVRFACGDFTTSSPGPPGGTFDVVWGQGSWIHVPDREALFDRALSHLRPAGRIAFEDACLRRPPRSRAERRALRFLEGLWVARIPPRSDWLTACETHGMRVLHCESLDGRLHDHLRTKLDTRAAVASEGRAAALARRLTEDGLLGYVRVIASR